MRVSRRMTVTYVQRWRIEQAEKAHRVAAKDPGALEPCPYCPPPRHPGEVCAPDACPNTPPELQP